MAQVYKNSALSQFYQSAANTGWAAGGLITLSHGLSSIPLLVCANLICLTSEHNYTIADIVHNSASLEADSSAYGLNVTKTATQLLVRIGNGGIIVSNKNTGVQVIITPANWSITLLAFAA